MKLIKVMLVVTLGFAVVAAFPGTEAGHTNTVDSVVVERDVLKKLICETRVANIAKCEAVLQKIDQQDYKAAKELLILWMRSDVRMIQLDNQCPQSDDGKKAVVRAERYIENNK